jgi:hypothetical protein
MLIQEERNDPQFPDHVTTHRARFDGILRGVQPWT